MSKHTLRTQWINRPGLRQHLNMCLSRPFTDATLLLLNCPWEGRIPPMPTLEFQYLHPHWSPSTLPVAPAHRSISSRESEIPSSISSPDVLMQSQTSLLVSEERCGWWGSGCRGSSRNRAHHPGHGSEGNASSRTTTAIEGYPRVPLHRSRYQRLCEGWINKVARCRP